MKAHDSIYQMSVKQVFAQSMVTHVGLAQSTVDQMFPSLDALLDIHRTFLRSFIDCQSISPDHSIEEMGDLLVQQVWSIFTMFEIILDLAASRALTRIFKFHSNELHLIETNTQYILT